MPKRSTEGCQPGADTAAELQRGSCMPKRSWGTTLSFTPHAGEPVPEQQRGWRPSLLRQLRLEQTAATAVASFPWHPSYAVHACTGTSCHPRTLSMTSSFLPPASPLQLHSLVSACAVVLLAFVRGLSASLSVLPSAARGHHTVVACAPGRWHVLKPAAPALGADQIYSGLGMSQSPLLRRWR